MQAEFLHRHPAAREPHAFGEQSLPLLTRRTAAGRQRYATLRIHDPMPRHTRASRELCEHAADEPCAARQSRALGNFAITRDTSARHGADCVENAAVIRRRLGSGRWMALTG